MEERKGFGSNFGFLMAAIGSAVGLGNIWGFPNKMGANGGFTFLIIYLILAACCGFIVMMGELALGRKTGRGAIGAYRVLSKRFKWLGWLGVLSAFLILGFYCALGGYCLKYVTLNVGNLFHAGFGTGTLDGAGVFGALMANQGEAVIYGLIFVALTMIIVMGGVGGDIEKVCSVGMPALFVMLVICIIRSCTLEGASEGLKYMFVPGWALANGVIKEAPDFFSVVSTAGGQMFFSLSLGDPRPFRPGPHRQAGRPLPAVRHHAERVRPHGRCRPHLRHPVLPAGGVCRRLLLHLPAGGRCGPLCG